VWRLLRITVLLLVLAVVAEQTLVDRIRTTSWTEPLWIGIYPLNGDGSAAAARYVAGLTPEAFADIEAFYAREAHRYGVSLDTPVQIELYAPPREPPPVLEAGAGPLATAVWSLKLRWYAAHADHDGAKPPPHIRVFVLYHDPEMTPRVPHSLGLQKGLIGVVYAFADRGASGSNAVVITHEVMHTLGASDKYDPASDAPLYPQGFAEPQLQPRYPQRFAEIMAGRRPISAAEFEMPDSLREVMVGALTAAEIRWSRP
jgi:hypothetical protein